MYIRSLVLLSLQAIVGYVRELDVFFAKRLRRREEEGVRLRIIDVYLPATPKSGFITERHLLLRTILGFAVVAGNRWLRTRA